MPRTSFSSSSGSTRERQRSTVFDLEITEKKHGLLIFRATGAQAERVFANESGGQRWQRVPKTEKRGRVQTSTVTCAVLAEPTITQLRLEDRDLEYQTCRSSGSGGQNVNKVESAVQLTHKPTGLMVRCESERSQHQNRATALALLRARLWEAQKERENASRASDRRQQVGTGMRGDKARTYRVQDGIVTDHRTGKKARLDRVLKGHLEDLH